MTNKEALILASLGGFSAFFLGDTLKEAFGIALAFGFVNNWLHLIITELRSQNAKEPKKEQ